MSFVWGDENVSFLKRRYEALRGEPLFSSLQFSSDPESIKAWVP